MSNLLTDAERASFTDVIEDHFDTFKRNINIFIEPKQNFNNSSSQKYLPGYQASATANPALTIISAVHEAIVIYGDFNRNVSQSIGKNTDSGLVKIKVKQATYDYIKANKIIKITIDGDSFNVASVGRRANFLNKNLGSTYGEIFYIFELEYTK
jgi:hypothetical protein